MAGRIEVLAQRATQPSNNNVVAVKCVKLSRTCCSPICSIAVVLVLLLRTRSGPISEGRCFDACALQFASLCCQHPSIVPAAVHDLEAHGIVLGKLWFYSRRLQAELRVCWCPAESGGGLRGSLPRAAEPPERQANLSASAMSSWTRTDTKLGLEMPVYESKLFKCNALCLASPPLETFALKSPLPL
jgi:hypothetical protein